MNIGIVGAEAAKFTPELEAEARRMIRTVLSPGDTVVSGGCHLGGVDIWAEQEGRRLGLPVVVHLPATLSWEDGYKPRNLQIARDSGVVYCLVVADYPPGYAGMRFPSCYHCRTTRHVKSGGCWTVNQARRMGKLATVFVVGGWR